MAETPLATNPAGLVADPRYRNVLLSLGYYYSDRFRHGGVEPLWSAALVRPAKAGLSSGRKSHRGKSQKPRS